MRSSDWSSDVCSSDLLADGVLRGGRSGSADGEAKQQAERRQGCAVVRASRRPLTRAPQHEDLSSCHKNAFLILSPTGLSPVGRLKDAERSPFRLSPSGLTRGRSEEHTSELQSLMRISYAVFCLKKKNTTTHTNRKDEVKLQK